MKIAINCRLLLKNKLEGIGWYTFEIVKRIVQNHPEHDFYFLFDRGATDDIDPYLLYSKEELIQMSGKQNNNDEISTRQPFKTKYFF